MNVEGVRSSYSEMGIVSQTSGRGEISKLSQDYKIHSAMLREKADDVNRSKCSKELFIMLYRVPKHTGTTKGTNSEHLPRIKESSCSLVQKTRFLQLTLYMKKNSGGIQPSKLLLWLRFIKNLEDNSQHGFSINGYQTANPHLLGWRSFFQVQHYLFCSHL